MGIDAGTQSRNFLFGRRVGRPVGWCGGVGRGAGWMDGGGVSIHINTVLMYGFCGITRGGGLVWVGA